MLGLIIANLILATANCQQRCAADSNRCYSSCRGSTTCTNRCGDRASDCNAGCSKEKAKAEAAAKEPGGMPCGAKFSPNGGKEELRPCSEAEAKVFKEAFAAQQLRSALKCRNDKGQPIPCKEDVEKSEELMKDVGENGTCKDERGNPKLCPEDQKKVEARLKKH
jgi:hypothetical protein